MTKFLLSLGLVAALAAPAAAGRLDVDPTVLQPLSISQAQSSQAQSRQAQSRKAGVDYSATRSIQSPDAGAVPSADDSAGLRLGGTDKQRGAQGEFFGANGR